MKENIKHRVTLLIELISNGKNEPISIRAFCDMNDINYKSLHNAFKADKMGIGLVDKFKIAVPNLNMNWFLYGEGKAFMTQ